MKNSYRWNILGLMTLGTLAVAVILQSIPPILGNLVNIFDISHAQAGGLMGLFFLPAIFLSLPGGMAVDRYGTRSVGAVALVAMALGTAITALAGSYWILALGRLVAGVGATVMLIVAPRAIASWFQKGELGLSMGVFNTAVPLGTILSLNFMGVIASRFGWQAPIWTSFAFSVMALFLFLVLYQKRQTSKTVRADSSRFLAVLRETGWSIWWVGLSWGLFNAALISYFTYAPDYFVSLGEDISRAGLLASYPMWASILLSPIAGTLMDRTGGKWLFVVVGCGGMAVLLYLLPGLSKQAAMVALSIGVFAAVLTPAIFALTAEILPERVVGFGFGILGTSAGIGVSVGSYVVGSLRDATGNYAWSFAAMATFMALGVIPMLLLKREIGKSKRANHK